MANLFAAPRSDAPPPNPAGKPNGYNMALARIAAIAACLYFLAHGLNVILGPELKLMEWLYDDSFYYLITASHFAERHIASFDGVTVTSGYHPLWMWLCAIVYSVRGHLDLTYVRSCMGLAFAIATLVLLVALKRAWRSRNPGLLLALALAATSYSALNNGATVMEWPLVLLSWALLHKHLLARAPEDLQPANPSRFDWIAFLIGLLGSFSRTDFGLVPAAYLAAAILLGRRFHRWSAAARASSAVAGSAAALPLVFYYNHATTGTWLQTSAQVKHLAASLATPFNPVPAMWQFLRILLYLPPLDLSPEVKARILLAAMAAVLVLLAIALVALALRFRGLSVLIDAQWTHRPRQTYALSASLFGILAYLSLDGFNTQATYGWYTGTVTGFLVILAAALLNRLRHTVAAAIVLSLLLANVIGAQRFGGNAKDQFGEVLLGRALHAEHPNARMAGGDVGKPSFYNNGTMFNLDGLMNNEVVPYLAQGTIHCYILSRKIEYLSNIGSITLPVTDMERRKLGKPQIPWNLYFRPVQPRADYGVSMESPPTYRKTDFEAIRASGECGP